MYKNQLQELAQRSCFNLPSYACVREGPDHAPRFKASVNFNGEVFESPSYCTTLRHAEHAAAEVALNSLSIRAPSRSLAARVLDETGVYKNLLQETAHMAGLKLPVYTTVRSGPGHQPVFACTVELAGISFTGEAAKTKKQAEKAAALAAWSALKRIPNLESLTQLKELAGSSIDEQEQAAVARVLSKLRSKEDNRRHLAYYPPSPKQRALPPPTGPKILPPLLYLQESETKGKGVVLVENDSYNARPSYLRACSSPKVSTTASHLPSIPMPRMMFRGGFHARGIAPAVHIRSVIPVCSAPPARPPAAQRKEEEEEIEAATMLHELKL